MIEENHWRHAAGGATLGSVKPPVELRPASDVPARRFQLGQPSAEVAEPDSASSSDVPGSMVAKHGGYEFSEA